MVIINNNANVLYTFACCFETNPSIYDVRCKKYIGKWNVWIVDGSCKEHRKTITLVKKCCPSGLDCGHKSMSACPCYDLIVLWCDEFLKVWVAN